MRSPSYTVKLIRNLEELSRGKIRGGALAIGNFDGVHRGHARLMERLIARARDVQGPAIVFTFDPHPVRLLRPNEAPPPLTWTDRKAELLGELGVDIILAYPTDEALLSLTAAEFFQTLVVEQLGAKAMVEGPNFFFGRDRQGNIDLLRQLCEEKGLALEIVEPLVEEGEFVSSSRVRQAVLQGDVALAARLLTRPYRIRGLVTHGAGRGSKIGFPTANVEGIDTLLPSPGVYAGRAMVGEKSWAAAINIGSNPTFGEDVLKVEAHLIDFKGSLYGSCIEVDLLNRLRGVKTFASVEELKAQLAQDVEAARLQK